MNRINIFGARVVLAVMALLPGIACSSTDRFAVAMSITDAMQQAAALKISGRNYSDSQADAIRNAKGAEFKKIFSDLPEAALCSDQQTGQDWLANRCKLLATESSVDACAKDNGCIRLRFAAFARDPAIMASMKEAVSAPLKFLPAAAPVDAHTPGLSLSTRSAVSAARKARPGRELKALDDGTFQLTY